MARYEVLEVSFINNGLRNPGDTVDYDGEAGPNLKALDVTTDPEPNADDLLGGGTDTGGQTAEDQPSN